jgi:hypothetical protein
MIKVNTRIAKQQLHDIRVTILAGATDGKLSAR